MVVVMSPDATPEQVDAVVARVRTTGGEAFVSRGVQRTIIGLVGDVDDFRALNLRSMPGVADVIAITTPYKLVSVDHQPARSTVVVGTGTGARPVMIGPDTFTLIAGPCAVESLEQTLEAAEMAKAAGATMLRGGAFKPRAAPREFQGLGKLGLHILAEVREVTGLPVVTEVIDPADADLVAGYADMLQVGARNMQNTPATIAWIGKVTRMAATICFGPPLRQAAFHAFHLPSAYSTVSAGVTSAIIHGERCNQPAAIRAITMINAAVSLSTG